MNRDIIEFINIIDKLEAIDKRLELLNELNILYRDSKTDRDIAFLTREKYETYTKFLEYKRIFKEVNNV